MNKDKQLVINMISSFIAYAMSLGINFFLSPYIVRNIGVDAYGFVGLANNFISYAGLITIALNSLAGRFITIKIYEKDMHEANRYFSSVFIANLIIAFVMLLISGIFIIFLEKLINIPDYLYWDVKMLFISLFANCILGSICSVFSIATFATNKLYLNSARQIESNILRLGVIVGMFYFFLPRVSYLGITVLIATIYTIVFNIYYTKTLLPDIHIKREYFSLKAIFELISSGIWNLINRMGQLLLDGLDLFISNIFIDAVAMGILSLAKTIPSVITGIVGNIVNVFSPNFTILYVEKKQAELVRLLKQSMKIMGIITNIPVIILLSCGDWFYELWQPTQNAAQLQFLSVLTCGYIIISGGVNCIYNIFTVVNKLKLNSIVVVLSGLVNMIIVYILLKTTDYGIYAIASVSTGLSIVRNLVFTVPYGAICLEQKWYTFYPAAVRPIIYVAISCSICIIIKKFIVFDGWMQLILMGTISTLVALLIGMFVILNKEDRLYLKSRCKGRL